MRILEAGPADRAIVGASIHTLDPARPHATCVAWRGQRIVAVGDAADVRPLIGPATDVLDGAGRTIVPGLVDSHVHPFWGTLQTRGVDLAAARTLPEVHALLRAERERTGPRGWVLGYGARYEAFHDAGIVAGAIDEAVGDQPAMLNFFDCHTSLANRPALALAGVDGAREFSESSEIVCDERGVPTGELLERSAIAVVRAAVPELTPAQQLDAFAATLRAMNAAGLTGGHVMVGRHDLPAICAELEARGDLSLRVVLPMLVHPSTTSEEVEEMLGFAGRGGERWRVATAKFFADGVIESGTAWLTEPGPGGVNVQPFWPDPRRYHEHVRRFTDAGFACATHAIGDGAVRDALDAYAAAGPAQNGMHRVEHAETLLDEDLPRFRELGVAASMQPLHMDGLDDPEAPSAWLAGVPAGRPERAFRWADLVASGAVLALGSDWMVADYDPRLGMAWARLRRTPGRPDRVPFHPAQALSAAQALAGYTSQAAVVVGDGDRTGRIAPGMLADLTGFADDPLTIDADELPACPVVLTVVDGRIVHRHASVG